MKTTEELQTEATQSGISFGRLVERELNQLLADMKESRAQAAQVNMKKKTFKGWITIAKKRSRVTSFSYDGDFILFLNKHAAISFCDDEDKVIKVVVTVEPAKEAL